MRRVPARSPQRFVHAGQSFAHLAQREVRIREHAEEVGPVALNPHLARLLHSVLEQLEPFPRPFQLDQGPAPEAFRHGLEELEPVARAVRHALFRPFQGVSRLLAELAGRGQIAQPIHPGVLVEPSLAQLQDLPAEPSCLLAMAQERVGEGQHDPGVHPRVDQELRWRARRLRRRNAELEALVLARTTELGRARERVAQAEKLSAMGQLLAWLSHEINNPLTAIHNNLTPVGEYFEQMDEVLQRYREWLGTRLHEAGDSWGETGPSRGSLPAGFYLGLVRAEDGSPLFVRSFSGRTGGPRICAKLPAPSWKTEPHAHTASKKDGLMRHRGGRRAVAVGLAVLLVQGCASVPHEGRSGSSRPGRASSPGEATLVSIQWSGAASEEDGSGEAEARRAEVEWALERMWAVASGEEQVGTVLEFTFWVERGAFTLLSQRRGAAGGERGQPAKAEDFTRGLRGLITTLAEGRTGAMAFTLHRERSRWRVDYGAASLEEPAEARKHAARRTEAPAGTLLAVQAMAKQVVRLLQVPAGASARMTVKLALEDDRLSGWKVGPYQAESGGRVRPAEGADGAEPHRGGAALHARAGPTHRACGAVRDA
ncbi:hypothetical protein [Archangium sp.]|uniref:hypothetical protein n=1 Tax=Archangium sp. TaxID=1872627 RepID=UPI002D3FDD4B|nr:hypothetical protein [Archangium sp.]HYO54623.1 hypothetical protein [Archangium sp.]